MGRRLTTRPQASDSARKFLFRTPGSGLPSNHETLFNANLWSFVAQQPTSCPRIFQRRLADPFSQQVLRDPPEISSPSIAVKMQPGKVSAPQLCRGIQTRHQSRSPISMHEVATSGMVKLALGGHPGNGRVELSGKFQPKCVCSFFIGSCHHPGLNCLLLVSSYVSNDHRYHRKHVSGPAKQSGMFQFWGRADAESPGHSPFFPIRGPESATLELNVTSPIPWLATYPGWPPNFHILQPQQEAQILKPTSLPKSQKST
ncbi:hypothetical protein VTK26DRAFT_1435 [Humicola hyalothermophila]